MEQPPKKNNNNKKYNRNKNPNKRKEHTDKNKKSDNWQPKNSSTTTQDKVESQPIISNVTSEKQPKVEQKVPSQKEEIKETGKDYSNHSTLSATIIEKLNADTYECMICTDVIRRQVAVWSCQNCFAIFHLYCIKKWSKTLEEGTTQAKGISWRCPGCQYIYTSRPAPKCYCGKITDPPFNAYLVPHSCGETCGKSRSNECPHSCTLTCHPGHCPPCSALAPIKTCFCGSFQYRLRCGQKDQGRSCGDPCEKSLTCGKHKCDEICHSGSCSPCKEKETQVCYCGKHKEEKSCGSGKADNSTGSLRSFSCTEICGRTLSCGNHKCTDICHPGNCGECSFLPKNVKNCPCGKIPLALLTSQPRTNCLDPIKTCPNVCGKFLACRTHSCTLPCHTGPCSECTAVVKTPCRCHSTLISMPCLQLSKRNLNNIQDTDTALLCSKVCKATRSCGRHACGKRCCPSSPIADPNELDTTGAHICSLICDKKLKCGKHKCDLLCHTGVCPPCHITRHEQYVCECGFTTLDPPILCGTKLPECLRTCVRARPCGHATNHACHLRETACPPCTQLVDKVCLGNHETRRVPCSLTTISCGRTCAKPLLCGEHNCKRICHGDACLAGAADESVIGCGQTCGKKRELCEHNCQSSCHPSKPCPKLPCKVHVRIYCPCKRRSVEVDCARGAESDRAENSKQRELLCDEQCEVEARNRRLAEAFGVTDRATNNNYPEMLVHLGKCNFPLIQWIERRFGELLKTSSMKYSFPPSDRVTRRIVHELAKHYLLDTESFDNEPNRGVVITKRKDSRVPSVLLTKVIADLPKQQDVKPSASSANSQPVYAVQLSGPSLPTQSQKVVHFLSAFDDHYHLKWLDEMNVLVVFQDQGLMRTALSILPGGPYQVSEYRGSLTWSDVMDGSSKSRAPKKTTIPQYKVSEPEWSKDNNPFSMLNVNADQASSWRSNATTTTATTTAAKLPPIEKEEKVETSKTEPLDNWEDTVDAVEEIKK